MTTGLLVSSVLYTPAAMDIWDYGFPLAWRTVVVTYPGPFQDECPTGCTRYDWFAFVIDFLVFTAIGYSMVYVYSRRRSPENVAHQGE